MEMGQREEAAEARGAIRQVREGETGRSERGGTQAKRMKQAGQGEEVHRAKMKQVDKTEEMARPDRVGLLSYGVG